MTLPNHPDHTEEQAPEPNNRNKWIPLIVVGVLVAMALTHFINAGIG